MPHGHGGRQGGYVAPHALDTTTSGSARVLTFAVPDGLALALDHAAGSQRGERSRILREALREWLIRGGHLAG